MSRVFSRQLHSLLGMLLISVVASLAAVAWHSGRATPVYDVQVVQELFNWNRFSAQQDALIRRADDLTTQLRGSRGADRARLPAAVEKKGAEIKQVLAKLMRGLQKRHRVHQQHSGSMQHKYIPMDQELAILKVQKQMRTEHEHRFRRDRIEGGGDVAAVVNEQELADERSALMEDPDMGPSTKTEDLFENCEDGSLTEEDAELCGRRATAIKMLTRVAIQKQLTKDPPVSPSNKADSLDAEREDDARKKLLEYALIGKQYVAMMDAKKRVSGQTQAKREALIAEGRHRESSSHSERKAPDVKEQSLRATGLRNLREARGARGRKRKKVAAPERSGESGSARVPAKESPALHAARIRGATPSKHVVGSKRLTVDAAGHRGGERPRKTAKAGDLRALQNLADTVTEHKETAASVKQTSPREESKTPAQDSRTRITDLEGAITATQTRLAREKMRFAKEMLAKQKELQAEFLQSMQQIHAGLVAVGGVVSAPGGALMSAAGSPRAGKDLLAAEQAAFMRQQRDGVIAAAASVSVPAQSKNTNPVVSEVEREIAASHIFKHPQSARAAAVPRRKSVEDAEAATVKAALERQWDQVASDGRVAPKVRHDKWTDLMTQMSQALVQQQRSSDPGGGSAGEAQAARGTAETSSAMQAQGAGATSVVGPSRGSSEGRSTRAKERHLLEKDKLQGLRLLDSDKGQPDHIGPESYDMLAAAATRYMRKALRKGAPTMEVATQDALKADELARNPKAELRDAERVLCTVAMLKSGRCSSQNPHKHHPAPEGTFAQGPSSRGLVRVPSSRSRRVATRRGVARHLANDVKNSVIGIFSPN